METGLLSVAARPRYVENFATLVIGNISLKLIPVSNTSITLLYNSSLIYEIGALKLYAEPLLYGIDNSSPYYEEVVRLLNFLDLFVGIPTDEIPSESVLREFIGGSYFE